MIRYFPLMCFLKFCVFVLPVAIAPAVFADVVHDAAMPQAVFAAAEIQAALDATQQTDTKVTLQIDGSLGSQAYRIETSPSTITVTGGDPRGLIYGGLELAEQINFGRDIRREDTIAGAAHIKRRGLKFNIPLDIRTPSYQDAGENMEDRDDEFDRVNWHWMTYGQGVVDAKKEQPDREVRLIHRAWQAGWDKIMTQFVDKYPDPVDFSYKYARARMYSTPKPRWADGFVTDLRKFKMKSWWNIRNDDIFHFRWGDAEYAREFIKNLPPEDVIAGYHMGSDSTVWAREFISIRPNTPRDLEIHKHWYNFMLFGRLGYDPDLPTETILQQLQRRFPETDAAPLAEAWASASKIVPLVNQFHWHSWDFQWAVEGCLDLRKGFHDVNDVIKTPPMQGSGLASSPASIDSGGEEENAGKTPENVAQELDDLANASLKYVRKIRESELVITKERSELLYDMEAMSHLGLYYANKIRGASHLYRYTHGDAPDQLAAVARLEDAL
jgi:hypothetical protein